MGAPLNAQTVDTVKQGYMSVANEKPVAELEEYIKPYRDSIDAQMNRVIGTASQLMVAKKPESALSNFVADVIFHTVNQHQDRFSFPKVDFAITNIKGIRSSINQGDIAVKNVFEILPFENTLVVLGMTGQQVQQLFDFMASQNGDGLSGASFVITNCKAFDCKVGGKKLKPNKMYYLAAPDYVANGGDSYSILTRSRSRTDTDMKIRDVVIAYIEEQTGKGNAIVPNTNRRILNANEQ